MTIRRYEPPQPAWCRCPGLVQRRLQIDAVTPEKAIPDIGTVINIDFVRTSRPRPIAGIVFPKNAILIHVAPARIIDAIPIPGKCTIGHNDARFGKDC